MSMLQPPPTRPKGKGQGQPRQGPKQRHAPMMRNGQYSCAALTKAVRCRFSPPHTIHQGHTEIPHVLSLTFTLQEHCACHPVLDKQTAPSPRGRRSSEERGPE